MGENSTTLLVSGTAREGTNGPTVGHVDIGLSESAYLFRVALPGVRKNHCVVSCEIERDGNVHLQGIMNGGELENKAEYQMNVAQLSPPGPFTVFFKLPGPVDPRLFSPTFRTDGIIEGVVLKPRAPSALPSGNQFAPA